MPKYKMDREKKIEEVIKNIRESLMERLEKGEPAWFEERHRDDDGVYMGSRFTFNFNFDTPETATLTVYDDLLYREKPEVAAVA